MLKIPKQIYFDQEIVDLYTGYARAQKKPFAAVIRAVLIKEAEAVRKKLAKISTSSPPLSSLYGTIKSPYPKVFTPQQERAAFIKAMAKNSASEGTK